jgi:hypothetical protein
MGRMLPLTVAFMAVGGLLALPSVSAASHDPSGAPFGEDFVSGTSSEEICDAEGCVTNVSRLDAHSGPSGESPTGTTTIEVDGEVAVTGRVTCLSVTGTRATVGVDIPTLGLSFLIFVEDNSAAGSADRAGAQAVSAPPTVCPSSPTGPLSTAPNPDFVVHDAPPLPTSKDQCKNGGWRNFPGFKNEGLCVAFVQRGPRA